MLKRIHAIMIPIRMNWIINILLILLIISTSSGCADTHYEKSIVGKWRPINNSEVTIEFKKNGHYNLIVKDQNVTSDIIGYGQLYYSIVERHDTVLVQLLNEDRDKIFQEGIINELSSDKLNISFLKATKRKQIDEVLNAIRI